jgi:hypothetical protein
LASGGGSDIAAAAFGGGPAAAAFAGTSVAGAIVSFVSFDDVSLGDAAAIAGSGAGVIFGAVAGLISMLACSAMVSDVGGAIPPDFDNCEPSGAGFADAAAAAGGAVTGTGTARAGTGAACA